MESARSKGRLGEAEGDAVVRLLASLVSAAAENPPGREDGVANLIVDALEDIGISGKKQSVAGSRENVVGELLGRGPGPTVVLNTHMDVVPAGGGWRTDPFVLTEEDGRLFGRGACDAQGSLAAMITALRVLSQRRDEWEGRVVLAAVVDEEQGSLGARALGPVLKADAVIVGEPTIGKIGIAHRGSYRPIVEIIGHGAHASVPWRGANAISAAAVIVNGVERLGVALSERCHPLVGTSTVSVTGIRGGAGGNVIPDECEVVIDRRMLPGESRLDVDRELGSIFETAMEEVPGTHVRIVREAPTTGFASETAADDASVKAFGEAVERITGTTAVLSGLTGNCDLTHFREMGTPGVIFGPGNLDDAHGPNESVTRDELVTATRVYVEGVISLMAALGRTQSKPATSL